MQLSIAFLALRGIMMRMRMRQEGGFYAMKQHTDSREPGSGGEVFKEHHTDSREPGIGEEVLKLRSADVFFRAPLRCFRRPCVQ